MFLSQLEASLVLVEERSEKLERSNHLMVETIAAREQAEAALRKSEEKYRILVENAGGAIFIAQNGILQFCNKKAEVVSGYTIKEMVGEDFRLFIHPDDREMVLKRHFQRVKGMGAPVSYFLPAVEVHLDLKLMNIKGSWVHIGKTLMNLVSNAVGAIIIVR